MRQGACLAPCLELHPFKLHGRRGNPPYDPDSETVFGFSSLNRPCHAVRDMPARPHA